MDLFSEALALVDDGLPVEAAAICLVAAADGSAERLLEAESRARALERALPDDARAQTLHETIREAARLAVKSPSDVRSTALSGRLAETGAMSTSHTVDSDQLAADLERLRTPIPH